MLFWIEIWFFNKLKNLEPQFHRLKESYQESLKDVIRQKMIEIFVYITLCVFVKL